MLTYIVRRGIMSANNGEKSMNKSIKPLNLFIGGLVAWIGSGMVLQMMNTESNDGGVVTLLFILGVVGIVGFLCTLFGLGAIIFTRRKKKVVETVDSRE